MHLSMSENHKRTVMVRKIKDKPDQLKVYFKGAPEAIIPVCSQTLDENCKPIKFNDTDQSKIFGDVIIKEMAE